MKPQSIGRALGIGLRVAGRLAVQQAAPGKPGTGASANADSGVAGSRAAGKTAGKAARGAVRGVGGFFKPFRRVGGKLWLEVTGVFFALPVVVFLPTAWKTRGDWAHGPDHRTFLIATGIVLLFLYLSVSSFVRARQK
jgi:hypothetical protein